MGWSKWVQKTNIKHSGWIITHIETVQPSDNLGHGKFAKVGQILKEMADEIHVHAFMNLPRRAAISLSVTTNAINPRVVISHLGSVNHSFQRQSSSFEPIGLQSI